jgi:acyl carrier protein
MVKMLDTKSKSVIIFNFSIAYKQNPEFSDFFIANDLGTPMAVMVVHNLVELTAGGQELIEETWISLCQAVDADPLQDYLDLQSLMHHSPKADVKGINPELNLTEPLHENMSTHEDYNEVKYALIQIIFEVTGQLTSYDDLEIRFDQDLGVDSLAAVEILAACEERFNIDVLDEDGKKINSVSDAIGVILKTLDSNQ